MSSLTWGCSVLGLTGKAGGKKKSIYVILYGKLRQNINFFPGGNIWEILCRKGSASLVTSLVPRGLQGTVWKLTQGSHRSAAGASPAPVPW